MTKIARLGDYVKIQTGKFDVNAGSPNGIYPFFTCAIEISRIDHYAFDCECVLVAGNGDLNVKYYEGKFNAYQRTYVIESKDKEKLDVMYLYYFLSLYVENLRDLSIGGVIKYIKLENLTDAQIPLPKIEEQKRIVSILDKGNRLRQLRHTANDLGDALLQSVFLEMFGDLTINQKNWDLFFLEDIADVHGGIQVTSTRNSMELQKPYLRVANVYRNQLELSEIKMIGLTQSEFERTKLQKDDLLFVEGHGNINEIGRAAVWDGSIEDCVHQNHLICARLDLKLANPIFVSTYVNSPAGKSYFTNISNTTSGLNTISTNTVRSCPIPLPPLSLQEEFAGVVARVESLRGRMGESTRQVEGLFESLLAEAFS